MCEPCFTDPRRRPTEAQILAALGRAAPAWNALFERLRAEHPPLAEDWRYYADGKSWLLKVSNKSKTVFWLMVEKGGFRVSFYFPDRVTGELLSSRLSRARKAEIASTAPTGKLRRVSVRFGPQREVQDVIALIGLKKVLK